MNTPTTIPPTDWSVVDRILDTLKESQSFSLSGHQNPDGDVIGSQLAMASFLRRLDPRKTVTVQNSGSVPKNILFLPGANRVLNVEHAEGKYDVLIVFECSGADRMGNIVDFKGQVGTVINIDHHLHNPNFGHINFVEPKTSSTAELIFKIIDRAGIGITADEAVCLYTGMVMDTGWFRYGNTNVQTHEIAARLLEKGVPVAALSERVYLSRSKTALRLLASCLSRLTLHFDDRVALMTVPKAIYDDLRAASDDVEEIVNQGLQIESVVASVLMKEKTNPPNIKISFRSKGDVDINQIARAFGGGGHKNASGCQINAPLAEAEAAVLKEMQRLF